MKGKYSGKHMTIYGSVLPGIRSLANWAMRTNITEKAKQIETKEELINSAKVSVENDELAALIGEAQFELGKDGVLIAEETAEPKCSVEYVKGVRIDNGFGTSVIINNQEKQLKESEYIIRLCEEGKQVVSGCMNLIDHTAVEDDEIKNTPHQE